MTTQTHTHTHHASGGFEIWRGLGRTKENSDVHSSQRSLHFISLSLSTSRSSQFTSQNPLLNEISVPHGSHTSSFLSSSLSFTSHEFSRHFIPTRSLVRICDLCWMFMLHSNGIIINVGVNAFIIFQHLCPSSELSSLNPLNSSHNSSFST